MTRLITKRLIIFCAAVFVVLLAAAILTALAGRIVKAYLEKGSDRFRIESVSFGWGTIEGGGVQILDGGQEVARAKTIVIRPSLLTLFREGFLLSRVTVENPTLALTISKNNQIISPFSRTTGRERGESTKFQVGLLKIKNGILTINDQRNGKPAQLQVYNVNASIEGFSNPLADEPSTVRASGQLSGSVFSGYISSSGTANLKTGALHLVCEADGLKAFQSGVQKPQLHIERLSLKVESTGLTPVTLKDVRIDNPYYRYASEQRQEITEAVPGLNGGKQKKEQPSLRPVVVVQGVTVKGGEVVVTDSARPKGDSEISIVDVSFTMDQFALPFDNTASAFDLSGRVPGRQNTAELLWKGTVVCSTLDMDSRLSLQSLDLTTLRPYLEKKGDASIESGTVDIAAHVKIQNRRLDTPVDATVRNLELAPARGLRDQFMGVPRSLLLSTLKTKNNEIRVDFMVSGPIDSPKFSLRDDVARRFAIALARSLGLSAFGAGETAVEQGARAIRGAGKGIKGLGEGVKRLFGR